MLPPMGMVMAIDMDEASSQEDHTQRQVDRITEFFEKNKEIFGGPWRAVTVKTGKDGVLQQFDFICEEHGCGVRCLQNPYDAERFIWSATWSDVTGTGAVVEHVIKAVQELDLDPCPRVATAFCGVFAKLVSDRFPQQRILSLVLSQQMETLLIHLTRTHAEAIKEVLHQLS